jgi:FMN phosphatase YigB (HAD superfamily)/carbamoylphosphate synthase large subunit
LSSLLTVVVTSGGGFQGLTVVKALRESRQVRVVLVDCHEENVTRFFADCFHVVPKVAAGEEFLARVLDVCLAEGAALVMPSTSFELPALAGGRERFREHGVMVAVSDPEFLRLAGDKRLLYPALARAGLPVLPVLDAEAPRLPYPVIAKPASGWGSRGVVIATTAAELSGLGRREEYVLQRYLEHAEELSADFSIDFRGSVSRIGLRRRVRTTGGYAVISDTTSHPGVEETVAALADIARGLGARGVMNVQVLTRGSELYVSDVNPRPGTSASHWCGTGINPALHVCASVRPEIRVDEVPTRVHRRSVRYLEELRLEAEDVAKAGATHGVVFDLDDTLIPQKRWIAARLEAVHEAHAAELPDRPTFLREALCLVEEGGAPLVFDELALRFGLSASLRDRLIGSYRAARPSSCELFPDVLPTLATLHAAGLKLAVLTDNPPASQRAKLEAAGLLDRFDVVVYTQEAGGEKPDPRGFAEVATRLDLPAEALAMVGNNPYRDVGGGAGAGFGRLFLVRRPGHSAFDTRLFRGLPGAPRFVEIDSLTRLAERLR